MDRWCAIDRWRAMRRNPLLVIGQKKGEAAMRGPLYSPRSNSGPHKKRGVHIIVGQGFTHCITHKHLSHLNLLFIYGCIVIYSETPIFLHPSFLPTPSFLHGLCASENARKMETHGFQHVNYPIIKTSVVFNVQICCF